MKDQDKSREQLISELEELRQRVSALEASETEWRRTEEALQGSEERFRLLVEAIPQPIWRSDADGNVIEFNRRWHEYTGQTAEEAKGHGWTKALHPDEAAMVVGEVRAGISSGAAIEIVNRLRAADGSYRWHLARAVPMNDRCGKIIGWFGCATDIDDQKRAEEALRRSEARLIETQEVARLGFYVLDISQGRWTSSRVLDHIFAIPPGCTKTVEGWGDLLHPDERQVMLDYLRNEVVGNKKPFDREYRIVRCGDQQVRWVHGLGHLQCNEEGQPVFMLGTIQDITERKRAEEAILAQNAMLEGIIESTDSPIFSIDRDYCYTSFNSSHAAIMKTIYGAEITLGKSILECQTVAEDRITAKSNLDRTLRGEQVVAEAYSGKDKLSRPLFEVSHNPITGIDGNVIGAAVFARDITARKRAEAALKDAHDQLERRVEERTADLSAANEQLRIFQQFAEASGQGFSMADLDGRLLYMNPALCRMVGEDRPQDRIGQHVSIYYPEEVNRSRETERFPSLMRDGYWQGELPMLSRQGKVIPTWHNTFLIRDESGEPARIAVVITDITERKRAEEALRQSHDEIQAIYDGMQDGLLIADVETKRFVRCNAAMCRMLGHSERELLSRSILDIHPPDEVPKVLDRFQAIAKGEKAITTDVPVLRKDGGVFYADISHHEVTCNGRYCSVGVFRDTTERKQAEEALRASEERYELAVRGAGVGIWDWDIRTDNLYFSPRWKMLFGYGENDIGNSVEDWAGLLHPDEKDWMLKFLEDFLAGTSPTVTVEYRLRHKDGSYRWIVATGLVLRDEQGKAYRFVGSHGDITDRKLAEAALEREHRTLEHMLRASDHERQLIAYDIHDGLAQYLTGAIMQLDVSRQRKDENPREAAKAYDAGMLMVRQGLAEARRLISGVRPPILDESGILAAIAHLVYEYKGRKGPKIEFHSEVEFGRLAVVLENSIYRIVQEGLSNASKHSTSKKVRVELVQHDDQVRIVIRDQGVGFDPTTVEEGRFGLEGIRERARLLGGNAVIESSPGKGTRIAVDLPIVLRKENGQ